MTKIIINYKPTPKQMLFHQTKAKHKLFGWAAWWGKTDWLLAELLINCIKYPGIKQLFVRKTYSEIKETLDERLPKLIKTDDDSQGYRISWNAIHFNDSIIILWYWQDDRRNDRYFSTEYDVIAVDEITRTIKKKTDLQKLLARNRTTNMALVVKWFSPYFMCGTNPGGAWHVYIKDVFIDGRLWKWRKKSDFVFIPSKVEDNPYIMNADPDYIKRLESMSDTNLMKALRYWDWNIFEWQFFTEWYEHKHVVNKFPEIPNRKKTILCLDYWWRAPSAVYMIRICSQGHIYISNELYQEGLTYFALWVECKKKYWSYNPDYIVADPAIFSRWWWSEESWDEMLSNWSWMRVVRWNNNRDIWRNLIKKLLQNEEISIYTDCTNLIKTMPELEYDEKKDNDLDTWQDDHGADSIRYGLMDVASSKIASVKEEIKMANNNFMKSENTDNLLSIGF